MEGASRSLVIVIFVSFLAFTILYFNHKKSFSRSPQLVSDNFGILTIRSNQSQSPNETSMVFVHLLNSIQSLNNSLSEIQTQLVSQRRFFNINVTENEKNGCPSHKFVMTTGDSGGLGNRMSEYATLLALSAITGFTPVIGKDHKKTLTDVFPLIPFEGTKISQSCMDTAKALNPRLLTETNAFIATKPVDHVHNIRLHEYPNGVFYYNKIRGLLKEHLRFKPEVDTVAEGFLVNASLLLKPDMMDPVWVGIHVRRTSYKYHLNVTQNGTLVTFEYFERAIKRLEESLSDSYRNFEPTKMVFVVASDDNEWCKTQFGTIPNKTVIFAEQAFTHNLGFDRKYLDMAIMSKCNHSIFDYGTFGFWGAYLAGGHTILAHNIGTGMNPEVENVRQAELPNWHFIEAHGKS
ncbi:galactoside alpha-(1,2)-fucosyltransferase 2-like [Tigriopus californicus]|uniref:galactoside alpha-(1,2)-fucosyltransferase 2-like n=1 Tax=Tigriopus californicus TaxID=6832 RepID=UPI0027DA6463|nr:galactoside alpha-(1,2)-fucosyltransferase 2-like [Tigriopus californicus]